MLHAGPFIAGIDHEETTGEPETACSIIPLLIAGGIAAAAGAGAAGGAASAGRNGYVVRPPTIDKSAFGYRGQGQGAMQGRGDAAAGRSAFLADYSQANQDRALAMGARGAQENALGMYQRAAAGEGPSAAQHQFASALDQSIRAQAAAANSVRGGGLARAAARDAASAGAADMRGQAIAQSAALRAQEQQAAMAGYAGLGSQMRAGDMNSQGLSAQQAQFQAQLQAGNREANDRMQLGYEQLGARAAEQQQMGSMSAETLRAQQALDTDRANAGISQNNANNAAETWRGLAGGLMNMGGALMTKSDERAKTDVRSGDGEVRSFLDELGAHLYRYKNPEQDGAGERVSPMAQELERTKLGARMVQDTPDGKVVDYGQGLGTMLAAQANLNDRLGSLEALLKARTGRSGKRAA